MVYVLFLYNIASFVYIMRLVDAKKPEDASKIKSAAIKFLPVMIIVIAVLIIVL